jgi:anti-sigma regulatory factor (Ser/Thr protein kinase)
VPSKLVFNLNLALDELITNIVRYAYPDDNPTQHVIRVRITLDDAGLTTVLSDDGRAYDPFSEAQAPDLSASIDDRPIGGLGVHLVRTLFGDVAYERVDGLNRVTLRQAV